MEKVIKRVKVDDGQPLVNSNTNPILNTSKYLVEMANRYQMELMANIIV